jgi:phosphoribosylformimino-5-aminoimidazole carboxamide ribotide isomerase
VIAIPAVDLRDGACVQLVGGSYAAERVRIPDPLRAARRWADAGFRMLHVVDLDAATGAGSNASTVDELIECSGLGVQVGGGLRTTDRISAVLRAGATRVVVGTRAIDDPEWLAGIAAAYPHRIVVAADVRERRVVTHGWAVERSLDVADLIREIAPLPLAGVLVTAVQREGLMQGTDIRLMEEIAAQSEAPLIASGGLASTAELRALAQCGVGAAVLGMSLYTGVLDARAVAEEFQS